MSSSISIPENLVGGVVWRDLVFSFAFDHALIFERGERREYSKRRGVRRERKMRQSKEERRVERQGQRRGERGEDRG